MLWGGFTKKREKSIKNKGHHLPGEKPTAMGNSVLPAIELSLWTLFEYLYSFCVFLYLSYTRFRHGSNFALRFFSFLFFPFLFFFLSFYCSPFSFSILVCLLIFYWTMVGYVFGLFSQ